MEMELFERAVASLRKILRGNKREEKKKGKV